MSNFTFWFKDLIPDFDTFKEFVNEAGFDTDTMSAKDLTILEHCYKILYWRYSLCNVRYTTPEAFFMELAITFDNEFNRYTKRFKLLEEIYKLTNDDLITLNEAISNYANNPNDEVSNPKEPLSYISSQTFSANMSNKLQAYLVAIESLPTEYDEEFLQAFKHLFIGIIPKTIPLYIEEEN